MEWALAASVVLVVLVVLALRRKRATAPKSVVLDGERVDSADDYRSVIDDLLALAETKIELTRTEFVEGNPRVIVLATTRGEFTTEVDGDTDWVDFPRLLALLNEVLEAHGAKGRLREGAGLAEDLGQCTRIHYVDPGEERALRRAGRLEGELTLPAEEVNELPCAPGTTVTFHSTGKIKEATLARAVEVEGIPCAAGPVSLGRFGKVQRAVLSHAHAFGGVTFPAGSLVDFWEDAFLEVPGDMPQPAPAELVILAPLTDAGVTLRPATVFEFNEAGELWRATLETEHVIEGIRCARRSTLRHIGNRFRPHELVLVENTTIRGIPCAAIRSEYEADVELHENGEVHTATLAAPRTFDGHAYPVGTKLELSDGGSFVRVVEEARFDDENPLGPLLEETVMSDPEVHSLADLARLYPAPDGHEWVAVDGVYRARRLADGALFSLLVEAGMLTFSEKRFTEGRLGYETVEVERVA